jgi:glycosyltransferase involved in cell wall biosynthesis
VKIAMLGTRGVPAAYSGFETAVENIGTRLAERGHDVTVYCRPHMVEGRYAVYRGMRLVYLPTIASKHLDTFVHTILSTVHMAAIVRPGVALYFIAGNSPSALLSRLLGVPSVLNVDGLDSRRAKWSGPARRYLRWAERNAPRLATRVITDSRVVQRLYREVHGSETVYIPYGAELPAPTSLSHLKRLGLRPRGYVMFVGRLVPENNAHVLIEAFQGLDTDLRLVIVGDAPYADDYQASLRATTDPRVLFTGYLFGEGYWELLHNASIVVAPTEVGGTHPALVEAMAAGNCVVVNDHPPNLEVIGDAGVAYRGAGGGGALREILYDLLCRPERVETLRRAAAARAADLYSWGAVTDAYERLLRETASGDEFAVGPHEEALDDGATRR